MQKFCERLLKVL